MSAAVPRKYTAISSISGDRTDFLGNPIRFQVDFLGSRVRLPVDFLGTAIRFPVDFLGSRVRFLPEQENCPGRCPRGPSLAVSGCFLGPEIGGTDARYVARPARPNETSTPTSDDWRFAVSVVKMIESFAKDAARETIVRVARLLEREGYVAHRSADRLERRSEFAAPASLTQHGRAVIEAMVSDCYTDDEKTRDPEPWHAARTYLARLADDELEAPDRMRNQAAILLDAAETLDRLLRWYEARRAVLKTRDLTNDTIVAIMREWKTQPRATASQLTAHDHAVTEGALKAAVGRTAGLGRRRGNVETIVFYIPGLQRRQVTS